MFIIKLMNCVGLFICQACATSRHRCTTKKKKNLIKHSWHRIQPLYVMFKWWISAAHLRLTGLQSESWTLRCFVSVCRLQAHSQVSSPPSSLSTSSFAKYFPLSQDASLRNQPINWAAKAVPSATSPSASLRFDLWLHGPNHKELSWTQTEHWPPISRFQFTQARGKSEYADCLPRLH